MRLATAGFDRKLESQEKSGGSVALGPPVRIRLRKRKILMAGRVSAAGAGRTDAGPIAAARNSCASAAFDIRGGPLSLESRGLRRTTRLASIGLRESPGRPTRPMGSEVTASATTQTRIPRILPRIAFVGLRRISVTAKSRARFRGVQARPARHQRSPRVCWLAEGLRLWVRFGSALLIWR